ncbi:MAG: DUF4164 domain-containing protein [Alcanivorax sp.]|nr:DUF4164 domain-containing protein [Alcanivorax sp.]
MRKLIWQELWQESPIIMKEAPTLDMVLERLAQAVARLESALARRGGSALSAEAGEGSAELQRALDDARAEYAKLSEVTGLVSQRLDRTINRLKLVLEK